MRVQVQHHLLVLGQTLFREPHANLLVHECRGEARPFPPPRPGSRPDPVVHGTDVHHVAGADRARCPPPGSVDLQPPSASMSSAAAGHARPPGRRPAPAGRPWRSGTRYASRGRLHRRRRPATARTSRPSRAAARAAAGRGRRWRHRPGSATSRGTGAALRLAQRGVEPDADDHHGAVADALGEDAGALAVALQQQVVGPLELGVEVGHPGAPPRPAPRRRAAAASPSGPSARRRAEQDAERDAGARRRLPRAAQPAAPAVCLSATITRPSAAPAAGGRGHIGVGRAGLLDHAQVVQNPSGRPAHAGARRGQRRALQVGVRTRHRSTVSPRLRCRT